MTSFDATKKASIDIPESIQSQSNLKHTAKKKPKQSVFKSKLGFNLPPETKDNASTDVKPERRSTLAARRSSKRLSRKSIASPSRKSTVPNLGQPRHSSKPRTSKKRSTRSSHDSDTSSPRGSRHRRSKQSKVSILQSRLMSIVESKLLETRNPFADETTGESDDQGSDYSKLQRDSSDEDSQQPGPDTRTTTIDESKMDWLIPVDDDDDSEEDEEEEEDLTPVSHDDAYKALKKVYDEIQASLNKSAHQEINLSHVQDHFSKLWQAIYSSHTNELRLIQTDRTLSTALSATLAKSRFILKLAEDDPDYAQKLAVKLEKAWVTVDAGDVEERSNKSKIDTLRQEIFELHRSINRASAMRGQTTLKELGAMKSELERQRDAMTAEVSKFRSSLNVTYAKRQELYEKKTNLSEKERFFDEEFAAQQEAVQRELARKERLTSETNDMLTKLKSKRHDAAELLHNLNYTTNKISETETALRDQRTALESAIRDAEYGNTRVDKLRLECEAQSRVVERLTLESYRQVQELKDKESDVNVLKHELKRAKRQRSLQTKKVIALQQALNTLEMERENLKNKINFLEQELEVAQKRLEQHKKKVEELIKEKSSVNRNLERASAVTSEHANQAANHELAVDSLEKQVHIYNLEIAAQRSLIARLENERDFYSNEATKLAHQVDFRLNEMKKQDLMILKYKKKLGEIETQVKKSQQVCDAAVNDKKIFERFLRDTLEELLNNNSKLRHLATQVSSLKYLLNAKDEIIHLEALRYDRTLKETEFFSKQAARIQRIVEDVLCQNQALESERSTLGCAIAEIEGELSKQNYYANSAESRSLIHYRKLMDREIELQQVWNTWRKQHSTIRIGASHYKNLMNEIITLRYNILLNRRSNAIKSRNTGQLDRYRHEEAFLSSCIYKEKCMIGGLETQMRHPINVHRWRVLEATNPEAYEMVLKINLLTKRVVERTCAVQDLGKQLVQQEDMYVEVRKSMENCPGLEVPEEATYYQHLLNAKRTQYALLHGELQLAEAENSHYRSQIGILNKKLEDLKKQFFCFMQKHQGSQRPNTMGKPLKLFCTTKPPLLALSDCAE